MDENTNFDPMLELAMQIGQGVDLVEAVGGDLNVSMDEFDPASDIGMLMSGIDAMIPDDAPYKSYEEDFE